MVLRRQILRDSQDLLVLFTPSGRIDCVARGSLKRSGLCEPLTCLQVQLYAGRSLPQLQEATLQRTFPTVLGDLYRMACAGYLLHLWFEAFPGETEDSAPFRLLQIALEGLDAGLNPAWLLAWVELQALRLTGVGPELRRCVGCGSLAASRFSAEAGGVLCSRCPGHGARHLSGQSWDWLRFLRRSPLGEVSRAEPESAEIQTLARMIRACVLLAYPGLSRFQPEKWDDENTGD